MRIRHILAAGLLAQCLIAIDHLPGCKVNDKITFEFKKSIQDTIYGKGIPCATSEGEVSNTVYGVLLAYLLFATNDDKSKVLLRNGYVGEMTKSNKNNHQITPILKIVGAIIKDMSLDIGKENRTSIISIKGYMNNIRDNLKKQKDNIKNDNLKDKVQLILDWIEGVNGDFKFTNENIKDKILSLLNIAGVEKPGSFVPADIDLNYKNWFSYPFIREKINDTLEHYRDGFINGFPKEDDPKTSLYTVLSGSIKASLLLLATFSIYKCAKFVFPNSPNAQAILRNGVQSIFFTVSNNPKAIFCCTTAMTIFCKIAFSKITNL